LSPAKRESPPTSTPNEFATKAAIGEASGASGSGIPAPMSYVAAAQPRHTKEVVSNATLQVSLSRSRTLFAAPCEVTVRPQFVAVVPAHSEIPLHAARHDRASTVMGRVAPFYCFVSTRASEIVAPTPHHSLDSTIPSQWHPISPKASLARAAPLKRRRRRWRQSSP